MSERGRLAWRCRRGMRELDMALGRFADTRYEQLDARSRAAFERLLECADADIFSWLLGAAQAPDPELASLVEEIRASSPGSRE